MGQPRVGDDPVEVLEGLLGGVLVGEGLGESALELGDLGGEALGGLRGGFKLGPELGGDALSLGSLGSELGGDALGIGSLGLPLLGRHERSLELGLELRDLSGESGADLFDLRSLRSERVDGALELDSLGLPLLRLIQRGVELRLELDVLGVGTREERRVGLAVLERGRELLLLGDARRLLRGCLVDDLRGLDGSLAGTVARVARSGLVGADEAAGDDQQQRDAQRGESHGPVDAKRHDGRALRVVDRRRDARLNSSLNGQLDSLSSFRPSSEDPSLREPVDVPSRLETYERNGARTGVSSATRARC